MPESKTLFRFLLTGIVSFVGLQDVAEATCAWSNPNGGHSTSYTVMPPSSLTLTRVPLGQAMGFMELRPSLLSGDQYFTCYNDFVDYELDTSNLTPSGYSNIWKTNIPGVGVSLTVTRYESAGPQRLPFRFQSGPNAEHQTFPRISVAFYRIGVGVVSGQQEISFKSTLNAPGLPKVTLNIGPTRVNILNEVYFETCTVVNDLVEVNMGQEQIERIRNGRAIEHPFHFDVSCVGLKPNAPGGSVRTYFEGNAVSDGLLRLTSSGPEAATGIGIALANDSGVKLPFSKAKALPLAWNRSAANGEIYRFSGVASYALTSGPVKPGKADAAMSFVMDYN